MIKKLKYKLTAKNKIEIAYLVLVLKVSQKEVAKTYGVNPGRISEVVNNFSGLAGFHRE